MAADYNEVNSDETCGLGTESHPDTSALCLPARTPCVDPFSSDGTRKCSARVDSKHSTEIGETTPLHKSDSKTRYRKLTKIHLSLTKASIEMLS